MAKEKFSIIAIEETGYWAGSILEDNGIEAAFGYYLIRNGEATHICSFTPSSWCYFIKNEFVYASDNDAAHEWAGDNMYGGGESGYFGYIDPEKMDQRFIAETFEIEVEDDLTPKGRETDAYHTAIWKEAEEAAHDLDRNQLWAEINDLYTYRQYRREQAEKAHAQNKGVLSGANQLPLFAAAAKANGIDTYEKAQEIGWL